MSKKRRPTDTGVVIGMWVLVYERLSDSSPEQWGIWNVIWSDQYGILGQSQNYESVRQYFGNEAVIALASRPGELNAIQRKAQKIFDQYRQQYDEIQSQWRINNPGRIHGEMREAIANEIAVPKSILQSLVFR